MAKNRFFWCKNAIFAVLPAIFHHFQGSYLYTGSMLSPLVYKDIHTVMAAQTNLVEVLAKFEPRIVRMADARERAED